MAERKFTNFFKGALSTVLNHGILEEIQPESSREAYFLFSEAEISYPNLDGRADILIYGLIYSSLIECVYEDFCEVTDNIVAIELEVISKEDQAYRNVEKYMDYIQSTQGRVALIQIFFPTVVFDRDELIDNARELVAPKRSMLYNPLIRKGFDFDARRYREEVELFLKSENFWEALSESINFCFS